MVVEGKLASNNVGTERGKAREHRSLRFVTIGPRRYTTSVGGHAYKLQQAEI